MSLDIQTLRDEAQALLQVEHAFLNKMLDQQLLSESDGKKHNQYDKATIDKDSVQMEIAVLRGEEFKLSNLEMVLAVVGTMKAGKSTTINAIVGSEILPNRNAPMTAIPTLIRHTPTQKIPRLLFSEKAGLPLNKLINELKKAISNKKNAPILEDLKSDKDLYVTVEKIQQGLKIQTEALGEKEIFSFLVCLNDLVRIAPKFDLTFPFDEYQNIDQLPVIEIEFSHLQGAGDTEGKLILLDTPGPNEAGQAHLRPMLQEQLKRASAVLAVMDYTQLKSEADAQVREDLQSIAGTVKDRIYALVNKFDNCDRNGMQADEVKTFVDGLTEGLIKEDRVYPIAAKWGYLANRARHERDQDGLLPEITDETAWVNDFYQEAGLRRESLRTPERIADSIDDLWADSKLSQPLKDIIASSYDNAAILALEAAVDKLEECSDKIHTVLGVKEQSMQKSAAELKALISNLTENIKNIDKTEVVAESSIRQHQKNFSQKILNIIKEQFKQVEQELEQKLFAANEKSKKAQEKNTLVSSSASLSRLSKLLGVVRKTYSDLQYDPKNPKINFGDDKQGALEFLESIQNVLQTSHNLTNQNIEQELDKLLVVFEDEFKNNILQNAQKNMLQINKTLSQSGFDDIQIKLPSRKNLDLKLTSARLMQDALLEEQYEEKRTRVVDSKWGRFKNWLNSDWGQEEYTVKVQEYKVDMNKIKTQVRKDLEDSQKLLNQSIQKNIELPLIQTTEQFFIEFKSKISGLKKDIENSLNDKENSHQNDQLLLEIIQFMLQENLNFNQRITVLKSALNKEIKSAA